MVREIYYTTETKYIPNSGGRITITFTGILEDGDTKERVIFTRVYSEKNNISLVSLTQTGEFDTVAVLDVKALDDIVWENEKDVKNQQLRISYNYVGLNDEIVYDNLTIPFVGEYDYYLNNVKQPVVGAAVNGHSVITLCSYETLSTNINNKHLLIPTVITTLPDYITVSTKILPMDSTAKITPYEFTINVVGNVFDCDLVTFNYEKNVYELPLTIKQTGVYNNPRDTEFDVLKAREVTYLVQFNPV